MIKSYQDNSDFIQVLLYYLEIYDPGDIFKGIFCKFPVVCVESDIFYMGRKLCPFLLHANVGILLYLNRDFDINSSCDLNLC